MCRTNLMISVSNSVFSEYFLQQFSANISNANPMLIPEANESDYKNNYCNTPGTAGGPGGHDRTLAVKSRKNVRKITFFS